MIVIRVQIILTCIWSSLST